MDKEKTTDVQRERRETQSITASSGIARDDRRKRKEIRQLRRDRPIQKKIVPIVWS